MSFTLRQRGNPHEENILEGGALEEKEYEDFHFDEEKKLFETLREYHFEIFYLVTSTPPLFGPNV